MMRAWRVVSHARAKNAFTGGGAARLGGRWNERGQRIVYVSSYLSLAVLELLANSDSERIRTLHVALPIDIPEDLARQFVDAAGLPPNWQRPQNAFCAKFGSAWIKSGKSAILDVPSAVIPLERNFALNPAHPDFARIDISHPGYPLHLDKRVVAVLETG